MTSNYSSHAGNNFSTTSYRTGDEQDGGGFMNGSQQGSQDTPGNSKTYGQESLRPVTIKQIIDAQQPHPEADFKIDGSDVTQITFVGQVNNITLKATNIMYKIDDGTGIIEVMHWITSDAEPETNSPAAKEGDYLRVWGRLKAFNNKRHVGAHLIRPVADFNEVSYHLLEATAVHLYFTRGPPESLNGGGAGDSGNNMFVDSFGGNNNAGAINVAKKLPPGVSQNGRKVYDILQNTPQNNEGIDVNNICAHLGMDRNSVLKAGDELLAEGLIYTTLDDETWAVLEC